jgi:hypothetical protein
LFGLQKPRNDSANPTVQSREKRTSVILTNSTTAITGKSQQPSVAINSQQQSIPVKPLVISNVTSPTTSQTSSKSLQQTPITVTTSETTNEQSSTFPDTKSSSNLNTTVESVTQETKNDRHQSTNTDVQTTSPTTTTLSMTIPTSAKDTISSPLSANSSLSSSQSTPAQTVPTATTPLPSEPQNLAANLKALVKKKSSANIAEKMKIFEKGPATEQPPKPLPIHERRGGTTGLLEKLLQQDAARGENVHSALESQNTLTMETTTVPSKKSPMKRSVSATDAKSQFIPHFPVVLKTSATTSTSTTPQRVALPIRLPPQALTSTKYFLSLF